MNETMFLEEFKTLLKRVEQFPSNLSDLKREISSAISEEKQKRIQKNEMSVTKCILEEDDLNKLAQYAEH